MPAYQSSDTIKGRIAACRQIISQCENEIFQLTGRLRRIEFQEFLYGSGGSSLSDEEKRDRQLDAFDRINHIVEAVTDEYDDGSQIPVQELRQ